MLPSRRQFDEAYFAGVTSGVYATGVNAEGTLVVDADATDEAPGRLVNHSRLWKNCVMTSFTLGDDGKFPTGVVYIKTERAVPAGTEFLVDYGANYWKTGPHEDTNIVQRLAVDYLP